MVRKKIDSRIRTLVENGVNTRHRSMFVLVGDHGRDQVVNLHYMLSKAVVKARPSVLWCYKKELGFSSHKKKRMNQIKKKIARGLLDADTDDPFELFVSSTNIRYTYYADSHKILGNTYGMCVLQDFEALTPNLLARTIETVEGGGIIVVLLRTLSSLKQLYNMSMEAHGRFKTGAHSDVKGRFNERFILSLGDCANTLVLDDELNILPISAHAKNMHSIPARSREEAETDNERELKELKESLVDTEPAGSLISRARTLDQAKAILTFIEAISEKNLRSTVALTASRGRGKSAALGLSIASAVAYGYSNIFVTSPSPENLKTLFEFVFKGFDALDYTEHLDYEIIQSTNPAFNKAIVRINIFKEHRQTIQYILPQDSAKLGQAELVVIDEAAAIPLPLVKNLMGSYLVFMASTINGYEGTGRSLSLKLIQQLRDQSRGISQTDSEGTVVSRGNSKVENTSSNRVLKEIGLEEPIRYAEKDPIEAWLHNILCLDASIVPRISSGCPSPSACDLYYINRDTLFSYHKASETFLQRLMALYVASHYKNSPNDLQLMSDAPAHNLFCLLGPIDEESGTLPEILCVLQVCLEGEISRETMADVFARGKKGAAGDLIPWTVAQQFQDNEFGGLSGARVVRIATHPDYQKMGYGKRALELLKKYYQGDIVSVEEDEEEDMDEEDQEIADDEVTLGTEVLKPKANLPPLLLKLNERKPERLHYLGVSYGLTDPLFKFWKTSGFRPVYLRQTPNELTGEHSCIMLYPLQADDLPTSVPEGWLDSFCKDFRKRFVSLLGYQFREFNSSVALRILDSLSSLENDSEEKLKSYTFNGELSDFDIKRLESYSRNMVDYHVIIDILPLLARTWFTNKTNITLSSVQAATLLSLGLQYKTIDDVEKDMNLHASQLLALFNKSVRKFATFIRELQEAEVSEKMNIGVKVGADGTVMDKEDMEEGLKPLEKNLKQELKEASDVVSKSMNAKKEAMIKSLNLEQYAITGNEGNWEEALASKKDAPSSISVRNEAGIAKRKQSEEKRSDKKKKKSKKARRA
eukprot:Nk52_evm67s343 gene=Nk52_evmTU67s343